MKSLLLRWVHRSCVAFGLFELLVLAPYRAIHGEFRLVCMSVAIAVVLALPSWRGAEWREP